MTKIKTQGVSLPTDLLSSAKLIAESEYMSLSAYVCQLIKEDLRRRGVINELADVETQEVPR